MADDEEEQPVSEEDVTTTEVAPPPPATAGARPAVAAPHEEPGIFAMRLPAPPLPGESSEDSAIRDAIRQSYTMGSKAETDDAIRSAIRRNTDEQHSFWGQTGKFLNNIPGAMEETAGLSYAGILNAIGSTLDRFDPDKRFKDQSVPQLLDGVGNIQDRINELTAKKNSNSSEYNFVQTQNEIDSLEGDLRGMRRALSDKSGYPQPSPGQFFRDEAQKTVDFLREERGEKPMPEPRTPFARFLQGNTAPYPRDVEFERSIPGKISSGIGQAMLFAGTGGEGGLGMGGEAALFAAPNFQNAYQQAIDQGKTPQQAAMAGYATVPGSAVNMLVYRTLLGSSSAGARTIGEVKENLWRSAAVRGAIGMPAANAAGHVVDNLVASMSGMDPNRPWNQGVADNVIENAVFGLVTGGIHDFASWKARANSKPNIDPYKPPGSDTTPQVRTPPEGGPAAVRTPDLVTQPVEHSSSIGEGEAEREALAAEVERELGKTEVVPTPTQTPAQQLGSPTTAAELSDVHLGIVNDMERLMNETKSGQPDVTARQILLGAGTPEEALSEGTNAAVAELERRGGAETAPQTAVTAPPGVPETAAGVLQPTAEKAAPGIPEAIPPIVPVPAAAPTAEAPTAAAAPEAAAAAARRGRPARGTTYRVSALDASKPAHDLSATISETHPTKKAATQRMAELRRGPHVQIKMEEVPPAARVRPPTTREPDYRAAQEAWFKSLSEPEKQAVIFWTQGSHSSIQEVQKREAQPGWTPAANWKNVVDTTHRFVSAMAKAPLYSRAVYRGLKNLGPENIRSLQPGSVVTNDFSSSASADPAVAREFTGTGAGHPEAQKAVLEFHGQHPSLFGGENVPGQAYQREVVLPKGARYRVQEFRENYYGPNQHHVVLEQEAAGRQLPVEQLPVEDQVAYYRHLAEIQGGKVTPEVLRQGNNLPLSEQLAYWKGVSGQPAETPDQSRMRRDAAQTGVVNLSDRAKPVTKGLLRSVVKGLIKAIGPRADFLVVNARNLPKRYDAALAAVGLNRNTFKAFYDHATNEFVVNLDKITDVNELYDAVLTKFLPNTFGDYVKVVPIRSWKDHTDNPDVNRELARDPNMDTTTSGLYANAGQTAFINVPKLLRSENPIREATRTIVHEIGIHQGLQRLFPSFGAYDNFLLSMYGKLDRSGVGNQIASQFQTTMEGLARQYKFGADTDGVWTMTDRQKMRMAEELLSRYAERFDPQQLSKLPNTLKRMLDLVHTGLDRWQGIELSHAELFHIVQDSWKASEPERAASSVAALKVKQAIKAQDNEDTQSEPSRRADTDTAELETNARRSGIGGDVPANDGRAASATDIRASSDRVGRTVRAQGNQYDAERLRASAPVYAAGQPGDTHDVRLSPGTGRAWKITRVDAESGPYGSAPASERASAIIEGRRARAAEPAEPAAEPGRPAEPAPARPALAGAGPAPAGAGPEARAAALPGEPGAGATGRYDTGSATAEQYLRRLSLANSLFGVGNRLEGVMEDPETGLNRIISTQPQYGPDNTTEASHTDIARYMAARGFEQIDSDTFYDPRRKVIVMEAHPDAVRLDQTTGKIHMLDANPHEVSGELALELDERVAAHDWSALDANPEETAQQLMHQGLLERPEETEAMAQRLEAQAERDRTEAEQIRSVQAERDLTPEEQRRLDDLEMGPMLKKDIEDELDGPRDPDAAPMELLKRAYESQTMARRMRPHPERMASDPKAPDANKLFNASPSQIETDKVGRNNLDAMTDRLLESYAGDMSRVYGDLVNGGFESADEWSSLQVPIYFRVIDELRARREEALARGDHITVGQLEDAHMRADQYMTKDLSSAGKTLAFWRQFIESREGMSAIVRAQYQKILEDRVNRDKDWQRTRDEIHDTATRVQNDALGDQKAQRIINAAQGAHDSQTGQGRQRRRETLRLVGEKIGGVKERELKAKVEEEERPLGLKIADGLTNEFARAIGVATRKAGLSEDEARVKSLADAVKAKIREQLPTIAEKMRGAPEEKPIKPSAGDTIRDLLNRWGDFENLFNQATVSMRHGMDPGRLGVFLQELKTALDMPLTDRMLNKFLVEQDTNIAKLVRGHWSYRNNTIDSLRDVLLDNTNLTPEQATLVDENLRRVLNSKITEQTQREFQRLIDQTEGGKATPQAKRIAMERLMEIFNMGAFSSNQVADALGILYGFDKSYLPSIESAIKPLIDRFEQYKNDSRMGRASVDIQYQLARAIAEHARVGFWDYWNNSLLGNLISGVPSHVAAFANELMTGSLNAVPMYYQTLLREGAQPTAADATRLFFDSVRQLSDGFAKSLPEAAATLRTGVSPKYVRFTQTEELGRPGIPSLNVFEKRATERILGRTPVVGQPLALFGRYGVDVPMRTVFRAVDALHSIISGTFANQTAHMLAVRMFSDQGMPFHEALDQARDMMVNPSGMRLALEQQARAEALSDGRDPNGWQTKMRLNELIEQHFPQLIRDESSYWASEANLFNKPYGALGVVDNALEKLRQVAPAFRQLFPIMRLAMNLYNYSLDLTPLGVWRSWQAERYLEAAGQHVETQGEFQARQAKEASADEKTIPYERYQELRGQLLFRGIVGTTLLGAVAALPQLIPGFRINGNGPSNQDLKHQMMNRGWQANTFQFGDHYMPFEYFPPFMLFGAIGNYYDALRYHHADPATAFGVSLLGLPGQILDRTVLMGLKNLLDMADQSLRDPAHAGDQIMSYLASLPAQATPVAGSIFVKNLTQLFDSRVFERHGWGLIARAIPLAASVGGTRPRINALGEKIEVNDPYMKRFWTGGEAHTPADRIFDFLNDHGLAMGNPSHHKLMGNEMTHDQLYDFTILKGQAMQRIADPELDRLGQISDPAILKKQWHKLEATASKQAIGQMLAGEHGVAQ